MPNQPIHICAAETSNGTRHYVTCLDPNLIFTHGLIREAIVGILNRPLTESEPVTPDIFARNNIFVSFMHRVIAQNAPQVPDLVAYAKQQQTGLVFILDLRTPTPHGTVPPEDIIGAFAVKNGTISTGSYTPSPNHKLLTSRGFFQLMPELHACLIQELTALTKSDPS